jgi:hypothetical protein
MRMSNYLGSSYGIWNGRNAWFWFVTETAHHGAAIGVAANEAEAVREARCSIEEMAEPPTSMAESRGGAQNCSLLRLRTSSSPLMGIH